MGGLPRNSVWEQLLAGVRTDREGLIELAAGQRSPAAFLKGYKRLVINYLGWLLVRHRRVADEAAGREAAEQIWALLLLELSTSIREGGLDDSTRARVRDDPREEEIWDLLLRYLSTSIREEGRNGRPRVRFRDALLEAVHRAEFSWSQRHSVDVLRARCPPDADEEAEFHSRMREDVLAKARGRLKEFQRRRAAQKCAYFELFCAWDEDHRQSHEALLQRFVGRTGRQGYSVGLVGKTLGRACEEFGQCLAELVREQLEVRLGRPITAADYRDAFEDLDLMDYVNRTRYCRGLIGEWPRR